ncbi:MAG: 30S ribosomal protein S5 [Epsilonproteobacteria bacterium]|nr:30S ribosomal protein S5 [Campylobacterota bacterium]
MKGVYVEKEQDNFSEYLIHVGRIAKVVKGGRRFRFNALVAVGDKSGMVGVAGAKSKLVSDAISKAAKKAKEHLFRVPIVKGTLPHKIVIKHGAGRVMIRPAKKGTGIVSGGTMRAILEASGYKDVVAKSLATNNPSNVAHATVEALKSLRTYTDIANQRRKFGDSK